MTTTLLPDYAAEYDPDTDFDRWYTTLAARRIRPWLGPGETILEIGSATCALTQALAGEGRRFTCIERAAPYVDRARARQLPGVHIECRPIETFAPTTRFDHVLAVNVLHELPTRDQVLRTLIPALRPGGTLHVTLPNPRSLHRLTALGRGLIDALTDISARGRRYDTVRLEEADAFAEAMAALGLRQIHREAILVKPLPNDAMDRLSPELIEAWDDLAHALPAHGAMTLFTFRHADA